jgi:hemolysin III
VGAAVFAATMVLLYLASTLYHALPRSRAKDVFQVIEHSAIFLLIAGTYTPFTLGVLRGPWGLTLFGLVWGLAAVGIGLKTVAGARHPILSTSLYLAMGWLVVMAIRPLGQDGWPRFGAGSRLHDRRGVRCSQTHAPSRRPTHLSF